ncbi:hypothetical protein NVP1070O_01 [Vibrio phage 1.070.O._10N.261.45.B2]|nr:hypothetical protein NVP1070O_01 [Vibrio phage 1.070.O._10N.261.45.B2]
MSNHLTKEERDKIAGLLETGWSTMHMDDLSRLKAVLDIWEHKGGKTSAERVFMGRHVLTGEAAGTYWYDNNADTATGILIDPDFPTLGISIRTRLFADGACRPSISLAANSVLRVAGIEDDVNIHYPNTDYAIVTPADTALAIHFDHAQPITGLDGSGALRMVGDLTQHNVPNGRSAIFEQPRALYRLNDGVFELGAKITLTVNAAVQTVVMYEFTYRCVQSA